MSVDLTSPIFHDTNKARGWLEQSRWPNGANCPQCGAVRVIRMEGKMRRPGLFHCRACRGQFTVLTGSVMERSHVARPNWVLAFHLMTASKISRRNLPKMQVISMGVLSQVRLISKL